MISKLNKASLIATNKEYSEALGIRKTYVHQMIKKINAIHPGLIKVEYKPVTRFCKIVNDDSFPKGRVLTLTTDIHTKGEAFINLPDFVFNNQATFLSSNELRVLGYLKSFEGKSFKGFLKTIIAKLEMNYGSLKRALDRLNKIKAIFKHSITTKSRIKNVFYQVNALVANPDWILDNTNKTTLIPKQQKIPDDYEKVDSWEKIMEVVGNL